MATFKTVRVVTGTKPPQYRAVNIVTSGPNTYPTYLQTTLDDRTFETVYNVGSPAVAGLKTVIISGASTPAPTVTSVTPTGGSTVGGDSVTIAGTNLTAATAVKFGVTNAASYVVNSAIQITAVSPAGSAGTVDVTVTTAGGTSATSASDHFLYTAANNTALDGAINGNGTITTTFAITPLVTTAAGIVLVYIEGNYNPLGTTVSGSTLGSFTRRFDEMPANYLDLWYAPSAGALAGETITVTSPLGSGDFIEVTAFGVKGVNTGVNNGFDSNAALPNAGGTGNGTIATSNANDFLIAGFRGGGDTAVSGWTQVHTGAFLSVSYLKVTSTQSALNVPDPISNNGFICDALVST